MKGPIAKLWVGALVAIICLVGFDGRAFATSPPALAVPAGLSLAEIKVTGSEFVMLQNNTGFTISDLSTYWLYGFSSSNPLASGISSSSQQLPSVSLANGQTVLLSSTGGLTCGAAVTAKLSISLTDSMGYLEVVQQSLNSNNQLIQTAGDSVNWGSSTTPASGQLGTVPSSSSDPSNAYYRYSNSPNTPSFLWQKADVDSSNACQMDVASVAADTSSSVSQLTAGSPPPAIFLAASSSDSSNASLPASDIGLSAPIVNELLPNPAGTGTDDTDEFIEIYNPNDTSFDLSGFKLEIGLTTKHDYVFPAGTSLPAKSFVAFYSADTGLALSNSGSQAWLLDPLGNTISSADAYGTAKDGQAWALANGSWYWTTNPTPNAENVINGVIASNVKSSSKKTTGTSSTSSGSTSASSSDFSNAQTAPAPLHPWTLAGVGSAALLYAGYEYRNDLARHVYRLRRYQEARRTARK